MAEQEEKRRKASKKASSAIVVPSVRTYRLWTPGQIRQAEALADSGNIRTAVDLCDWILADDKVRGALDGRIGAWRNTPLTFDGSGDRRRRKRAVKDLDLGEDWDAMFPDAETWQVNAWALVLGKGPGLLRWKIGDEDHGGRDIPVLEFYHPQSLRYDWLQRTWLRKINDSGTEEAIEFGDGVWFSHMPFGTFRPWALGLWRSLARWVLLKAYAISDYGRLGESVTRNVVEQDLPDAADALNLAEYKEGSKKLRKQLAEEIRSMARDSAIVLPSGFRYKLVEQSAATKDLFNAQIKLADNAIGVCIRGGNLATQVDGGSKAAAEVQERGSEQTNKTNDASAWVTTTHDQALTFWAESNYDDPKLAPWAQYSTEPEEDRAAKAEVFNKALDGEVKARTGGFKVKRKEFIAAFALDEFLEPGTEPEPATPPEQGTGGGDPKDPGGKGKAGKTEPEPKGGKASALARFRLASGDTLRSGRGFVDGQLYADALAENATTDGIVALEPTLDAVLEELDAATDYDDLRARLRARYATLDPEDISEIVSAAMTLGELAGRVATNQDA